MIAVVIVNYKSQRRTIDYVANEVSKISAPHRVIVVDNSSCEESLKELREGLGKDAVILPCAENLGFARANNLAGEWARDNFAPEYILFSNNDISFSGGDPVTDLCKVLEENEEIGIAGPSVVGLDGRMQSPMRYISFYDKHIKMYTSFLYMSRKKRSEYFKFDYAETAPEGICYAVSGSFFLVRAKSFFDCGMMDPNTFLYGEEFILSDRMAGAGYKAYYCPRVKVIHEHEKTTSTFFSDSKRRNMGIDSLYYWASTYHGAGRLQYCLGKFLTNLFETIRRIL